MKNKRKEKPFSYYLEQVHEMDKETWKILEEAMKDPFWPKKNADGSIAMPTEKKPLR